MSKDTNRISILLYKDSRCDMRMLDETVGAQNWQRRHYECKGTLFCSVGIKIGDEWIWKDDAGSESNVEKQKGEASDSFKRACTNWGIGRELYSSPAIWIDLRDREDPKRVKFFVKEIGCTGDGIIDKLEISDKFGNIRFQYQSGRQAHENKSVSKKIAESAPHLISEKTGKSINDHMRRYQLLTKLNGSEIKDAIFRNAGISSFDNLTEEKGIEIVKLLMQWEEEYQANN